MASFVYTRAMRKIIRGEINFEEAGADIRVMLVDATSTAGTEEDTEFVSGFTTLGELAGTNYARQAIPGQVTSDDDPNDRAIFDASDITWTALGADNAQAVAAVAFVQVTNDADSPVLFYIDDGGFPIQPNGGDISIEWNATGILTVQNAP